MFDARAGVPAAVTALSLCLLLSAVARAGEVPSTALAQSLQIDPLLLDSPALTFAFPQRVASRDTAVLAFGRSTSRSELFVATDGSDYGIGVTPRRESFGGFAYSQVGYLAEPSPYSYIYLPYNSSQVLQAGVGGRIRPLRLGIAVRGTRFRHQERHDYSYQETDLQYQTDHVEVAAGAGLSGHGIVLDAVYEWGDTRYKSAQSVAGNSDTLVTTIESRPQYENRVAVRLAVPAGSRLRVIAAGTLYWDEVTWSGQEFRNQQLQPLERTDRSKSWFSGLCFLMPVPHLDCLGVTGTFAHRDQVVLYAQNNRGLTVAARKLDEATLTVSAQRRLWRTLIGHAGFSTRYTRDQVDDVRGRSSDTELRSTRDELIEDGFSWGLGYTWRNLQAAGSMLVPPRLDIPIGTIDVYLAF